ncbi:iron-sulfur cluster repair di-iron protein [Chengkuizengella axinellae]|uniref:Iron-sulfur cluster repair di-iron protein n=1 Tax=Chengkuizengella axinellae TaxID=3064388 RepID=A0ABT9IUH5_9BACL|nr:iron-sulfur cluster repair di-iron protein [Chengkuizengella sp. 2205SS18-9]MDP5273008.1 iron-sulfur cluster repair di-iron protein [Chengkuizengella sp. 2205SS18-9]
METTFHGQTAVGEIVTKFPKSADLFKKYKIDFCCGGDQKLIKAVENKNVELDDLLNTLNKSYEEMIIAKETVQDWTSFSYTDLINHIINTHHRYLNEELPQLSPYVTKVLRVHGADQKHLVKVHSLFHQLKTELEQHTIKEENEVFPLILGFEKDPSEEKLKTLQKAIIELEDEHDGAGNFIKELREITNDFTPPADACGTYRLVYQRLEALESDIFQHVHLENNILFPRILNHK